MELEVKCHVPYMDDLKLIRRSEEERINEIQLVNIISNDIKIKFGLEKLAKFIENKWETVEK
jgi:hypothetical protein